ncbi:Beta-1,3-galactosyltransferase 5 [Cichlidogyrus casuarinus]|uniref:Hexosyltransferase n=1 Tax=Cichlidogyrus casuarinus TaxID=1844966 RepID=A0ABD2Q4V7_9PLAT
MKALWVIVALGALANIVILYLAMSIENQIADDLLIIEKKQKEISDYPMEIDFTFIKTPKLRPFVNPINRQKVKFLHKPEVVIPHEPIMAVFLVKSAVGNVYNRSVLRDTWFKDLKRYNFRAYFILGLSCERSQELISQEAQLHNDIIQANFKDYYRGLTRKLIAGLTWLSEQPMNFTNYLILTDDDYFVNVKNLNLFMRTLNKDENFMSGNLLSESKPVRDPTSKWYLSMNEYKWAFFPPFLTTGFVVMTSSLAEKIHRASPYVRYLNLDDVFLGFVVKKLKVKLVDAGKLMSIEASKDNLPTKMISLHTDGNPSLIEYAWQYFGNN